MRGDNAFPIDNEGLRKMTNGVTPTPALQPQLSAEVFATFVGMIDQTTLQRIFAGLAVATANKVPWATKPPQPGAGIPSFSTSPPRRYAPRPCSRARSRTKGRTRRALDRQR